MTIFNYTINYIDVALVAIMLLAGIIGYFRGIIISVVNFIRAAVGMFLCFYLSNNLALPIYEGYFRQRALNMINEKIVTSGNIDEVIANLNDYMASLPEFISKSVDYQSINISSTDIARSILTGVFEPIILVLLKIVIFIAVFIIFFGATAIIIAIVRKMSRKREEKNGKKSVLKKTDMAFGAVFGLLKAFILVLAITSVLMYILSVKEETGLNGFLTEVKNSSLINLINDINPFNAVTEGLI